MATPFAEAIMQSMVQSMDPTIAMQRDAMQGYLAQQQNVLVLEKAKTAAAVAELLDKCQSSEPAVKETYRRLLYTLAE